MEGKEEELIEFKWLDSKPVGSDTVVFKLEDGTMIKVKVYIDRVGVAVNYKNPDGSPYYKADAAVRLTFVPAKRTFKIPRSKLNLPKQPPKSTYG